MNTTNNETVVLTAVMPYTRVQRPEGYVAYSVSVEGGQGGAVTEGAARGNAIKILANLLLVAIRQLDIKLYLVMMEGGNDARTIPTSAQAKIVLPKGDTQAFEQLVTQCDEALLAQYGETDGELTVDAAPAVWHSTIVSEEATHLLLASLNGIPVGLIGDDAASATWNNIGILTCDDNFRIGIATTGADADRVENLTGQMRKILEVSGAEICYKL